MFVRFVMKENTTTVTVTTKEGGSSSNANSTLVWTLFISLFLAATLFMPTDLTFSKGYLPVYKVIFGDVAVLKDIQMSLGYLFCETIGIAENAKFVEIVANIFYWGYIAMLGIAALDFVLTIINMAFKGLRPLNKVFNFITTFTFFFCFIVMFASLVVFTLIHISEGFEIKNFLMNLGYLYILWFVLSLWLFVLKIKLCKKL